MRLEFVADGDEDSLTVLLPSVSRLRFGERYTFPTLAIITTNAGGFAGPPPGARKRYEVMTLDGEASILLF